MMHRKEKKNMSLLFSVAVKVHNDMKNIRGRTTVGNLNNEHAEKMLTDTFFMLIQLFVRKEITPERKLSVC